MLQNSQSFSARAPAETTFSIRVGLPWQVMDATTVTMPPAAQAIIARSKCSLSKQRPDGSTSAGSLVHFHWLKLRSSDVDRAVLPSCLQIFTSFSTTPRRGPGKTRVRGSPEAMSRLLVESFRARDRLGLPLSCIFLHQIVAYNPWKVSPVTDSTVEHKLKVEGFNLAVYPSPSDVVLRRDL